MNKPSTLPVPVPVGAALPPLIPGEQRRHLRVAADARHGWLRFFTVEGCATSPELAPAQGYRYVIDVAATDQTLYHYGPLSPSQYGTASEELLARIIRYADWFSKKTGRSFDIVAIVEAAG